MKDLRFGDFCYYRGEGFLYIGMDEDGCIHFCRPVLDSCFNIVEFEALYPSEKKDYDMFCSENGESHSEKCKRKGIIK